MVEKQQTLFISTLFHESHRTTDTYSLSLSSFYTLRHNFMSCNLTTKLVTLNVFTFSTYTKTFHVWCNLSSKFQGYQTFAELAFSQLADIPSFIPHFSHFFIFLVSASDQMDGSRSITRASIFKQK